MRPAANLPPAFPLASGSRPARVQSFPNLSHISQAASPPAVAHLNASPPPLPPSSALLPSPSSTSAFSFPLSQPRLLVMSPSPVQHVPRPRFHSFDHNGAEDEEEEKPPMSPQQQMMPAVAASTSPLLASQPQRSPEASPPSSSSVSPQRSSRSPGTLSFSEKRKLGKEAAKEAAVGGDTAGSEQPQPSPQPAPQPQQQGTGYWARCRRLLRQCQSGLQSWHDSKAFWLCVYSAALLLTSVGNSIYFKKMINKMENYVYFLNQFTTVIFTPIFFAAVWYQFKFTGSITNKMYTPQQTQCQPTPQRWTSGLTDARPRSALRVCCPLRVAFPKSKFFWMGVFDSISGVLTSAESGHSGSCVFSSSCVEHADVVRPVPALFSLFGAVHTSGSNQALLTNAVIPVTMLLSALILHHSFRKREYAGSLIIMCGIVTVLLPQLFPSEPSFSSERDSGGDIGQDDNSDLPLFNFLFLLSVVPSALSSIYKELAFLDSDIDSNYLQAWVSLWQTLFGFALIPLNTLSFLGPQAVRWDELLSSFVDGGWCLLGYNLVRPPHCTPHHVPSERLRTCDDCHGAWLPIALYVVFNVLFNVFTVLLIKYGSATLMFVIMTMRMPLVQLAFSMKALNDPPDSFGLSAAAGLAVILAGLLCYRWPVRRKDEDGHALRLEDGAAPLLHRAKTTGGLSGGDYQLEADNEAEARLIIPVIGGCNYNSFFAARHHRHHELIRLKRSDSEIRGSYFSKLGMPASPFLGRKSPQQPASSGTGGGGRAGGGNWAGSPLLGGGSSRSRTPPITYGSALGERKEEG